MCVYLFYPSVQGWQALSGELLIKFHRPIGLLSKNTWWTQAGNPLEAKSSGGLNCNSGTPPIQTWSNEVTSKSPNSELVELTTGKYLLFLDICFATVSLPKCLILRFWFSIFQVNLIGFKIYNLWISKCHLITFQPRFYTTLFHPQRFHLKELRGELQLRYHHLRSI